jgi:hypothetical protein
MFHVLSHSKLHFKKKDTTMAKNKYQELNKITLVNWVDKTLD